MCYIIYISFYWLNLAHFDKCIQLHSHYHSHEFCHPQKLSDLPFSANPFSSLPDPSQPLICFCHYTFTFSEFYIMRWRIIFCVQLFSLKWLFMFLYYCVYWMITMSNPECCIRTFESKVAYKWRGSEIAVTFCRHIPALSPHSLVGQMCLYMWF